jgi:hypothetical protein
MTLPRDGNSFDINVIDFHTRGGKVITKTVRCTLDIRDFEHRAGFSWLLLAANPHLSLSEIREALLTAGNQHRRSKSWIARRRWLFTGTDGTVGAPKNRDGRDDQVFAFIADHPKMSSKQIAGFLRTKGISRSASWIRQHRVLSTSINVP